MACKKSCRACGFTLVQMFARCRSTRINTSHKSGDLTQEKLQFNFSHFPPRWCRIMLNVFLTNLIKVWLLNHVGSEESWKVEMVGGFLVVQHVLGGLDT